MATRSLTGRQLIRQILNVGDIDARVTSMNINANDDEFENDTPNSQEIVSVNDNSEEGGNIILYYLGEVTQSDDDDE